MIAITRSAAITPSSMSFASSEASATEWIGTLRTSMASGMRLVSWVGLVGYDDGAGVAGDTLDDVLEVRDHGALTALLHEAADGVDLRSHRAAGEVALGREVAQLLDRDAADRLGVGGAEAEHGLRDVGGDDENVDLDGPREQGGAEILVDDGLHAVQRAVGGAHHRDPPAAVGDDNEPGLDERPHGRRV